MQFTILVNDSTAHGAESEQGHAHTTESELPKRAGRLVQILDIAFGSAISFSADGNVVIAKRFDETDLGGKLLEAVKHKLDDYCRLNGLKYTTV
jgi:hypothetical protein